MIYYPLSLLLLAGIKKFHYFKSRNVATLQKLLEVENNLELNFIMLNRETSRNCSILLIGEEFINNQPVCLILGDNFFYGDIRPSYQCLLLTQGAKIFGYAVNNPKVMV